MYIPDELIPKVYDHDASGRRKPTIKHTPHKSVTQMDRAEKVKFYYEEALEKLALARWWADEEQDDKM